jgi:DivIVA domain-containing protein
VSNKIVKEILEKKFKKSIFSGYDPFDVDNFFDRMIIYINDLLEIKSSLENEIES